MTSPASPGLRTRRERVGDVPQRWREAGEGFPVLLLHGIPTSPSLWRHVWDHLPDGVRGIAWEMTGYGESIPAARISPADRETSPGRARALDKASEAEGWRDLSLDAQADRLAAFLDHAGVDETLLAGHDLGGGVAQILAARHPDRVVGLVLVDSVCYDAWPAPPIARVARLGGVVSRLPAGVFKRLMWADWVRAHATEDQARASWDVHWPPYGQEGGPAVLVRQARALDPADTAAVAERLPDLAGKANRVVWGEGDPYLDPRLGKRLAADLEAPMERVPDAAHFVPESRPDRVGEAIRLTLDEILE